jgi:DNA-binding ferritin-like protein (Dps family)
MQQDSSMNEILEFFEKAELAGKNVQTVVAPHIEGGDDAPDPDTHNVAFEARQLKAMYLKLYDF